MFKGSMVALVTPMLQNQNIDFNSLEKLIEWHISAKTEAIIVAGTTGESATLSEAEQEKLIKHVVKQVNKRIPVIAGTGTNATHSSVERTRRAEKYDVDGCLVVTPYYNKPTQNGLYEHYRKISESTSLPIILYNVPGRTCCDLLPETVERLRNFSNIVGIKDATADMNRVTVTLQRCGNDFGIYSGDDATSLDLMQHGGHGIISVTANIVPHKMRHLCDAALKKDFVSAKNINDGLMALHKKLFLEANPIPTKWALNQMGMIEDAIRLPLLPLDPKFHDELKTALEEAGCLTESSY